MTLDLGSLSLMALMPHPVVVTYHVALHRCCSQLMISSSLFFGGCLLSCCDFLLVHSMVGACPDVLLSGLTLFLYIMCGFSVASAVVGC